MYVERLLQINMAALACLATLLLGMGQRSTLMPLGMLLAAMASVWISDIKGWFRLSKRVADLAAWGALAVCLPGAYRLERIAMISAVADFVVLLQVIQLFRGKDASVYWTITRLSVLQVVVAALLTQEILFGVLLVAYLFAALGAMSLLFLYSEWSRHHARTPTEPAAAFWSDPIGRVPLGREFLSRLVKIGVAALVVGVVVFMTVPRVGHGAWRGLGGMARSTVGFSGRMRLGELGKILQNPEEVMRVRLFDNATGAPYEVPSGVYLRGAVLTDYRRGEWRPPAGVSQLQSVNWVPSDQIVRDAPVRQEIRLEPLDRDELFCVWPFTFLYPDERVAYFAWAQRLIRLPDFCRDQFTYELGTSAFRDKEQVSLVPNEEPPVDTAPLLKIPGENGRTTVPGLVALARQWLSESPLSAADWYHRAILLEQRLRNSGDFSYSLQGQIRDSSLDPVEDFITKNPRGHCEYFATALCLMLRSQGIPSRIVIGYHATDFNEVGHYFHVRQLDAHSWVEAYLPLVSIPDDVLRERPRLWLRGGWLRLDATPSSQESTPSLSLLARIGKLFDRLNFAWTNYVMEMDRPRQRDAIYQPIANALQNVFRKVTDPGWWRGLAKRALEALGLNRRWTAEGSWVSWLTVGLALLIVVLALGIYRGLRLASRRWILPLFIARARKRRAFRAKVSFYRRFEAILARRGLVRRPSQTQREFALAAAATIAQWTGDPHATPALDVVEAFYIVRFGGATLDEQRAEAVEHALVKIAQSIDHKAATAGRALNGEHAPNRTKR